MQLGDNTPGLPLNTIVGLMTEEPDEEPVMPSDETEPVPASEADSQESSTEPEKAKPAQAEATQPQRKGTPPLLAHGLSLYFIP